MSLTLESLPSSAARLNQLACITFSGVETETFLQGQFSNDVSRLSAGTQQLNGYCNPKGRALCVFRLLRSQHKWFMILPRELADAMARRLTLYRMRARVEIEQPEDLELVGIINPGSSQQAIIDAGESWTIDAHRTLVIFHREQAGVHTDGQLENNSVSWRLADILAGAPQVYEATSEQLIPQHINLDLAEGVSFTKGCYPGQEIVARLRYLGKLKQRMIAVKTDELGDYPPGTPVFTSHKGDRKAGQVVDAVNYEDASYLLINVPADAIADGELHIGSATGTCATRLQLPYEITLEKSQQTPEPIGETTR